MADAPRILKSLLPQNIKARDDSRPVRKRLTAFSSILTAFAISLILISPTWAAKKKIVCFYIGVADSEGKIKNGHSAACDAMKSQIESKITKSNLLRDDYDIEIKNINDFSKLAPAEIKNAEKDYIDLITKQPEKYDKIYQATKKARNKIDPLFVETNFKLDALSEYLEGKDGSPGVDVVVGAHWLVPTAVAQVKSAGRAKKVRAGWIFTDYYENPLFPKLSKCIDMTFLGAKELVAAYQAKGVKDDVLALSGIPVSSSVRDPHFNRTEFLSSVGLGAEEDLITITLAGGGEGLGDFKSIVESIWARFKAAGKKVQMIAVTAKNNTNAQNLEIVQAEIQKKGDKNFTLKIEKFIPNDKMLSYVKASDLYIVKSGGISPTEGAVIGTPMILLDILGGHERDNAKFYEKKRIGIVNQRLNEIGNEAYNLITNINSKIDMKRAQAEFRDDMDFSKVADFALSPLHPIERDCGGKDRSAQFKELLSEIGLGSRDEQGFLKKGRELLSLSEKAENKGIREKELLGEARKVFNQALLMNPESYAAYYMMAHVENRGGNWKAAVTNLNKSIEFDLSGGAEGQFFHRGLYRFEGGQVTSGVDDLLKAVSLNPNDSKHQKDIQYRQKLRGIVLSKLMDTLKSGDPEKMEEVSDAFLKMQKSGLVGDYFPARGASFSAVCQPPRSGEFPELDGMEMEIGRILEAIQKTSAPERYISGFPHLSGILEKLKRAVKSWMALLEDQNGKAFEMASHYLKAISGREYNERKVVESYEDLAKVLFPENDGSDLFVRAIKNYKDSITDRHSSSGQMKVQAQRYYELALEYSNKIPKDSPFRGHLDDYVSKAKDYAEIIRTGSNLEREKAHAMLMKSYGAFLSQI